MKPLGQLVAALVLIGLISLAGYGGYLAYEYCAALFAVMDAQVAHVTVVALAVVLAAAWLVARGVRGASRPRTALALREEKAATYHLFLDYWVNTVRAAAGSVGATASAEGADKLLTLERLLALYRSEPVIRAHSALRALKVENGAAHAELRARFTAALVAIRKDLGADTSVQLGRDLERLLLPPVPTTPAATNAAAARVSPLLAPDA